MQNFWNSASPKTRRRLKWAAGVLAAYAIIGFLVLPPIVRSVATKRIARETGRPVAIKSVRLNPFTLSATVNGLLISDTDGEPFVSWDRLHVNFQVSSLFGRSWVFKEISTSRPFVRVLMNKDYTFNFSDIVHRFQTNTPATKDSTPPGLRVGRLQIIGAAASLTDLTPREPFRRVLGPIDILLTDFRTDPDNRNPYSFEGTTDAGEKFAWSGHFYLSPLRSHGRLTLENITLNKYAPLYQDFVQFDIRDGIAGVRSEYQFEFGATNRVLTATNTDLLLTSFRVAARDTGDNVLELPAFSVTGSSFDAVARNGRVKAITASDANVVVRRTSTETINLIEMAQPADGLPQAPGGILFLLSSVTNVMAALFDTTNIWAATVESVELTNCAVKLEDAANSRPVLLELDRIFLSAKQISNMPETDLNASLSLRWNTNGSIRADLTGSLQPPSADIRLAIADLELRPLDPYLESKVNVFILGSRLGIDGDIRIRVPEGALPEVSFSGNARLEDFSTVDGVLAEDLLNWRSVRVNNIEAVLHPAAITVNEILVDGMFARLVIETNRTINLLAALRAGSVVDGSADITNAPVAQAPAPDRSSTANEQALPKISIAKIALTDSRISFTDRSLTPNVNLTIDDAAGEITGLSSEGGGRADVRLAARVDGAGPVGITGAVNPFNPDATNEIQIVVKDVDLTPVSPYSGMYAGYRIARGKLNTTLNYTIRGRSLESQNVITLDQFTFGEKVESESATKLPVRLAIAVLKDRDGKIVLDVPIGGSLDDPEFKLGKVIARAFVNVITKIATSPFAALGAVFGGKGEEVRFQEFAPGASALTVESTEKLDAIVKGLYERPGLQLEIEGSVDPAADRHGLRRSAVERRIRTLKWMSLRKATRDTTTPEQTVIEPGERPGLVQRVYSEALSQGQISLAGTNTSPLKTPVKTTTTEPESQRGAAALMQTKAPPLPEGISRDDSAADARDPYEEALLRFLPVTEADFAVLAMERARAVRDYILKSGQVEADRLFLSEQLSGAVKTNGSRVYLQLR